MMKKETVKNLNVSASFKKHKRFSLQNKFYCAIIGVSLLQTLAFGVIPNIWYRPSTRELDTSNLFSDNCAIISVQEQQDILKTLEKELGIKIDDNKENYLLLHAILENPYLNSKEKEIFYKFIEYFNDNPFINREEIYTNMLNVNARFSLRGALERENNVLACYLPRYRDIVYFELFPSVDTMAHEDGHCINDGQNMPKCIQEGMTQLISSEYFSNTPFMLTLNYPYQVSFVKLLCEMIGANTVLQAYTEDKPEIIYEALDSIIGEEGKAKGVIEEIDWCMSNYDRTKFYSKEIKERASDALSSFLNYVEKCFFEDEGAYQYHLLVFVNFFTDYYGKLEEYFNYTVCKAYISSSWKEAGFEKSVTILTEEYLGVTYQK